VLLFYPDPELRRGSELPAGEIGEFSFEDKREDLTFSNGHKTVEWTGDRSLAWIPVPTLLKLHSGAFSFDFVIENMASRQIGVGFLLDWTVGPNWGFFGYLGSSQSAWSYDPLSGDIVSGTKSIHGGLPKFSGESGVISVEFRLPKDEPGQATFIVNGTRTPTIKLPEDAVVVPAACLLKKKQRVTLANFERRPL